LEDLVDDESTLKKLEKKRRELEGQALSLAVNLAKKLIVLGLLKDALRYTRYTL
jgi:hypothetical protein